MNYVLLGRSGLRVSELCLGTMSFGEDWGWGASKEQAKAVFAAFAEAGGNFIDTANRYTEGTSERFVGEFIQTERDRFVLATKYTLYNNRQDVNAHGNHRKNLVHSLEGSLKRLQTDYIDLLYLHAWDFTTPVDEVMRALDDLVRAGKVLYVGVSDTPAWIIAQANTLADWRGWTSFIGMQCEYSLLQREAERELIPMASGLGIGVLAWSPLASGALTGKYLTLPAEKSRLSAKSPKLNERSTGIVKEVVTMAQEIGCTPGQVALSWLRQQGRGVIPVVGARRIDQIQDTISSLAICLSTEQLHQLSAISRVSLGFPHDFLASPGAKDSIFGGNDQRILQSGFNGLL